MTEALVNVKGKGMSRGGKRAGSGPKPLPTNLRLLKGNPGGKALSKNEPKPKILKNLTPPDWLDDDAKKKWGQLAPELQRLGLLTEVDTDQFASYCHNIVMAIQYFVLAREGGDEGIMSRQYHVVDKDGKKSFVQTPSHMSVAIKYQEEAKKTGVKFGLDPSSRQLLVSLIPAEDMPAEEQRLKDILAGSRR